jgi:hypothetical protein
MSRSSTTWIVSVIIGATSLPFLYTQYYRAVHKRRRRDTSTWSTTTTVTQSSAVEDMGRGVWEVTVFYSYHATEYEGGEQTETFESEEKATIFAASLENRELTVRFDPNDPAVSELVFDYLPSP